MDVLVYMTIVSEGRRGIVKQIAGIFACRMVRRVCLGATVTFLKEPYGV